jgi:hypothetical protein
MCLLGSFDCGLWSVLAAFQRRGRSGCAEDAGKTFARFARDILSASSALPQRPLR